MGKRLHDWFIATWYGGTGRGRWLLPLAWLFAGLARLRRSLYERGVLARYRSPRPVVVVGNLTVGGSGKTPFVIWLAGELSRREPPGRRRDARLPQCRRRGAAPDGCGLGGCSRRRGADDSPPPVGAGCGRGAACRRRAPARAGLRPDPVRRRPAALRPGPRHRNRRRGRHARIRQRAPAPRGTVARARRAPRGGRRRGRQRSWL